MDWDETVKARSVKVRKLLLDDRLKEAVTLMKSYATESSDWDLNARVEEISSLYGYMLGYFTDNVADSGRYSLYDQLVAKSLLLNDDIADNLLKDSSARLVYRTRRENAGTVETITSLSSKLEEFAQYSNPQAQGYLNYAQNHEQTLSMLFSQIWTCGLINKETASQLSDLISSPLILTDDRALMVSAVTLSLFNRFDPLKLSLLGTASDSTDATVAMRALTGFTMAAYRHADILKYFPSVTAQIESMAEQPGIMERMLAIQMAILLTRETTRIDNKMRKEIIPALLKNRKIEDMQPDEGEDGDADYNPVWRRWVEQSGVSDKLREISELQIQGADIYMSTFEHLKKHRFFNEISNWWRPFDSDQPDIVRAIGSGSGSIGKLSQTLLNSSMFCDSDKYSFCFAIEMLPEQQRGMFMPDGMIHEGDEFLNLSNISEELQMKRYVQDIYRFVKLFPYKEQFWDPFAANMNIMTCTPLKSLVWSADNLMTVASYLLDNGWYRDSYRTFQLYTEHPDADLTDPQLYQKTGFSAQKDMNLDEAIDNYLRADMLDPDNEWTLRHVAVCYRLQGHWSKSLEFILRAEKMNPDNLSLQLAAGECQAECGDYVSALSRFSKVFYMEPDNRRALRALAWYSLLAGRTDKSLEYYRKLTGHDKPSMQDYLNAGHAHWVGGDVGNAVECYRKAIRLSDPESFRNEFKNDIPTLLTLGIERRDIPLMLDLII